jgi:hypothetical protein
MFPTGTQDQRLGPKDWVLGVEIDGMTKAYPFEELGKIKTTVTDSIGSKTITVYYDPASRTARVKDISGEDIPSVMAYWFAWIAFHPDTEVYGAPPSEN